MSWVENHFGKHNNHHDLTRDTNEQITETQVQIEKTRKARGAFEREIDQRLPGGLRAFRSGGFPVLEQIEGDRE
ncbi:MAG TPA: hypothetical protein VJQ25_00885 [Nitrospira sp.]|nr:hypothetical protein [Nitrospira sp.]